MQAMRKIVAGLFMSIDGVVERPDQWTGPHFNDEVGELVGSLIAGGDTLLLGRRTYQEFAEAFGSAASGDPMEAVMNGFPKVVVSSTLEKAEWQNSTLINHDVANEIVKLKQQPGGNINMSGSNTLLRWLLDQGLLDELHLLVFPVVVGSGKRLLEGEGNVSTMKLADSKAYSNGVLHLTYQTAAE
jgi:dihydrofolate reductase